MLCALGGKGSKRERQPQSAPSTTTIAARPSRAASFCARRMARAPANGLARLPFTAAEEAIDVADAAAGLDPASGAPCTIRPRAQRTRDLRCADLGLRRDRLVQQSAGGDRHTAASGRVLRRDP